MAALDPFARITSQVELRVALIEYAKTGPPCSADGAMGIRSHLNVWLEVMVRRDPGGDTDGKRPISRRISNRSDGGGSTKREPGVHRTRRVFRRCKQDRQTLRHADDDVRTVSTPVKWRSMRDV